MRLPIYVVTTATSETHRPRISDMIWGMRFDDGSPKSITTIIHGFYLFPLLLGAIAVIFGLLGILVEIIARNSPGVSAIQMSPLIVLVAVMLLGAAFHLAGRWMRRALSLRNPKAWYVHAAAGPVFLCTYAFLVTMGLWISCIYHGWGIATSMLTQLWCVVLPGVRLQRLWMSHDMKVYFGVEDDVDAQI